MQSCSLVRHKQQIAQLSIIVVLVIEVESHATNTVKSQMFVLEMLSTHDWHAQILVHCGF